MTTPVLDDGSLSRRLDEVLTTVTTGKPPHLDSLTSHPAADSPSVLSRDRACRLVAWAADLRAVLPDVTATVEDSVLDGATLTARVTFRGEHPGTPGRPRVVEMETVFVLSSDGIATDWWDSTATAPPAGGSRPPKSDTARSAVMSPHLHRTQRPPSAPRSTRPAHGSPRSSREAA